MGMEKGRALAATAGIAACAITLAACGSTTKKSDSDSGTPKQDIASSAGLSGRPDIADLCGSKPLKVAMVDGFSGNAWRKITRAEYEAEARKCPNIKSVQYLDANSDPQKYISSIDGLVAQGVNVIVGTNDFGSSTLAALRRATQRGVAVVPYNADPGGTPGKDYTDFVSIDYRSVTKSWATWLNTQLKGRGNILYIGGPAGNPQDTRWLAKLKEDLKAYPDIRLLRSTFLESKYDPASVQQATSGALSKYPKIDAWVSSYGASMTGAIRAYRNAGKPVPPIATIASSNELGCEWAKTSPRFEILSLDGTPYLSRIALRKGVAAAAGTKNDEPSGFQTQPFMDTSAGKKPKCNTSLPPDADLSSTLPVSQLTTLLNG